MKETLNNNKRIDSPRRHNNLKYMCTTQHRLKLHKAKTNINERRNK